MAATCAKVIESMLSTVSSHYRTDCHDAVAPVSVDRTKNVVITGVAECRNPAEWRDIAYRAIAAAAGCSIQIADAFRLGHFTEGRRMPILVKLNTVWDRRLV
jgi:hypothetical protein